MNLKPLALIGAGICILAAGCGSSKNDDAATAVTANVPAVAKLAPAPAAATLKPTAKLVRAELPNVGKEGKRLSSTPENVRNGDLISFELAVTNNGRDPIRLVAAGGRVGRLVTLGVSGSDNLVVKPGQTSAVQLTTQIAGCGIRPGVTSIRKLTLNYQQAERSSRTTDQPVSLDRTVKVRCS